MTGGDTGEPAKAEDIISRRKGVDPDDVSHRLHTTQILMSKINPDRDAVSNHSKQKYSFYVVTLRRHETRSNRLNVCEITIKVVLHI